MALRVLDLFSGIGGFSLGLERAGMRTIAFCEIDTFCRSVLAKHWPGVPIHDDVRRLSGDDVGPADVVCGGYPCQPFSLAGKRLGAEDDRHLWPEMRRLVAECRPAWFIGENVAGHIAMGLDDVLSDLEGLHYTCRTFVIPACAVGAPHRRDRTWVVAYTDGTGQQQRRRPEPVPTQLPAAEYLGEAHPVADGEGQPQHVGPGAPARGTGAPEPSGLSGERGRPWLAEPNVGRVAHGVPARVDRPRALGNSLVPQVAEEIGRAIIRAHVTA